MVIVTKRKPDRRGKARLAVVGRSGGQVESAYLKFTVEQNRNFVASGTRPASDVSSLGHEAEDLERTFPL